MNTASPIWLNAPVMRHSDGDIIHLTLQGGIGADFHPFVERVNFRDYGCYTRVDWDDLNASHEVAWNPGTINCYLGSADSWLGAMAYVPPIKTARIGIHWRT